MWKLFLNFLSDSNETSVLTSVTTEEISDAYDKVEKEIESLKQYDKGEKEINAPDIRSALRSI